MIWETFIKSDFPSFSPLTFNFLFSFLPVAQAVYVLWQTARPAFQSDLQKRETAARLARLQTGSLKCRVCFVRVHGSDPEMRKNKTKIPDLPRFRLLCSLQVVRHGGIVAAGSRCSVLPIQRCNQQPSLVCFPVCWNPSHPNFWKFFLKDFDKCLLRGSCILWAPSHTGVFSWLSLIFIKLSHKMIFLLLPHISSAVWSHFRLLMQPDASWTVWLHGKCHFPAISMLIPLLLIQSVQFNIIQWWKQDQITSPHLWRAILRWKVITYKNGPILLNKSPALILMPWECSQFPLGKRRWCWRELAEKSSLEPARFEELGPIDCAGCTELYRHLDRCSK